MDGEVSRAERVNKTRDGACRTHSPVMLVAIAFGLAGACLGQWGPSGDLALVGWALVACAFSALYVATALIKNSRNTVPHLTMIAELDPLTGIGSRMAFHRYCALKVGGPGGLPSQVGVILIDLDRFRGFNDQFGYRSGDVTLARVAAACAAQLDRPDLFFRWNGDKFIAVLPNVTWHHTAEVARELGSTIQRATGSFSKKVTCCIGLAFGSTVDPGLHEIVRSADFRLDTAKELGPNHIVPDPWLILSKNPGYATAPTEINP